MGVLQLSLDFSDKIQVTVYMDEYKLLDYQMSDPVHCQFTVYPVSSDLLSFQGHYQ